MKILFYVEPHALRDSFNSHSHPYKIFLDICRQIKSQATNEAFEDVDVRVFSNHILQELKFNDTLDMWPLILTPISTEQKKIEELATMWLPHGIKDWLELCTDSDSPITKFYIQILSRIKKDEFDFDTIVSWGQNQAIKTFSKVHNVQTIYLELSSMRPPFPRALLIDPVGVNGAASSTHLNIEHIRKHLNDVPAHIIFSALNNEFHQTKQTSNLFMSKFHPAQLPEFGNDAPIALIPLQLADDANLLLYSDYQSIEDFTENTVDILTRHGWNVLIKPHPHAYLRGGYVEHAQQSIIKKYNGHLNVKILHDEVAGNEYISLISAVDLIVTNNSSVGFEGLLCDTPCVTMGTACYSLLDGLPSLVEFLQADASTKEKYKKNGALIASYMLSFMFPLERKLAFELVKRIRLWKLLSAPPHGDADIWVRSNLEALGWSTWHDIDIATKYLLKPLEKKSTHNNFNVLEYGNA